ncbi:hypothetical protein RugamoR64_31620 [Duganella rhizosphaerae]|uniref:glycoside hydrolase family 99-like domain-containing protein n=1 Tax=Duganella rhizosphaerae TaxID=2885763 RepID=UPI0030EAAE1B
MQSKKRQLMLGAGATALSALVPAGKAGAVPVTPTRTLVAAYFGGWCNPMDGSQRWIHGDNPWGTYPTADRPKVTHRMGLFPERFPLTLQTEDDSNQMAQHYLDEEILTASQYGINVFAMNWFRDEFLNYPVINFKNSPHKDRMSFFLQWSNNSNASNDPPQDTREYFFEGVRRAALHMADPSYWRINGKPVFAIYSVEQIDRIIYATKGLASDYKYAKGEAQLVHDAFLQDCHNIVANVLVHNDNTGGITGLRNAARVKNNALANQPAGISTSGITGTFTQAMHLVVGTSDIGSWGMCETVQGMYVYNIRSKWVGAAQVKLTSYAEMMSTAVSQYNFYISSMRDFTHGKTTWWPTLMAGFDDSPWQASDALAQHCLPTPQQFAQHCAQVSTAHAGNTDTTGGITFICAWNEYGEGSWISPTSAIYNSRLESIQKYLKNGEPYAG